MTQVQRVSRMNGVLRLRGARRMKGVSHPCMLWVSRMNGRLEMR